MGKQLLASDSIIRLNNFSLLGLVQSNDWSPAFNTTDVFEMGREGRVATSMELESSGQFELESFGGTAGMLARMVPVRSGTVFTGFLYSGAGAGSNKNAYTIDEGDIAELQFDLLRYDRPDQVNFTRSSYIPRAFVNSLSGRIDAAGMGTETVSWSAQEGYGFDTPYHDLIATPFTRTTATTATTMDSTINSGYTPIYVYVDEKRYRTVATDANYITFVTGVFTIVGGDTIPLDAIVRGVFYKTSSPSATFPALVDANRGTVAFYVKGWQTDIFLDVADLANPTSSERLLKVQSADWSIEFNLEPLRQIAYNSAASSIYCRVPTTPYNVMLNLSMYEGDWAEWRRVLLRGGTNAKFPASGNDVYSDSYDFEPGHLLGDSATPLTAAIRSYTKTGQILQTLQLPDMRLESHGSRVNVGGRSEVSLSLKGSRFTFVGLNPTA